MIHKSSLDELSNLRSTPRILAFRILALIAGGDHLHRIVPRILASLEQLLLPAVDRRLEALVVFREAIHDDLRARDLLAWVRLGRGGNVPAFRRILGMRAGEVHSYSPERLRQYSSKNKFGKLRDQVVRLQFSFRLVPLVDPVDHAQQSESGSTRADSRLCSPAALHVGNQALHEMHIFLLAMVDALAQRRGQRMVFVQHDGDLAIAWAEDDL